MPRHFLIVGAGQFGTSTAHTLYEMGHEVVLVDSNERVLEELMNEVSHAVVLDATDPKALEQLGIGSFDTVVIAIGNNLEASILATVAAKSIGARRVIAKADRALSARVLTSVGADEVVRPEHDMGRRLARRLANPNIVDTLELGPHHGAAEIDVPDKLCGRLEDLRLPSRFGVQVIAVHRGDELVVSPGAEFEVKPGDRIVVIGSNQALEKLRRHLGH